MIKNLVKTYDVILNIVFVILVLFTAFVICYYTLPEQTSQVIAKALSYTDNPEMAATFMDYLNGFTIGAGFPLWFSQKATVSRYINNTRFNTGYKNTQEILAENIKLSEIQVEFQKAEAYRFMNAPTMPAKARLHYKKFIEKLEERENVLESLKNKTKVVEKQPKQKKEKKANKSQSKDRLDSLV